MPGLIAPTICRFTVHGTYAGREIANVLDMHIDTTGSTMSRLEAIEDQAAVIVSAWADEIMERLVDEYVATSVSWVDLNSSTGSVGETTTGTGTDFPKAGEDAGSAAPGNVAIRVDKAVTAARGQRQGRMYLVGMSEAETAAGSPNELQSSGITSWNTKLAAFLAAINQESGGNPALYDSTLQVVHTHLDTDTSPPVLEFVSTSTVQALTANPTLGSQRRRLRG